MARHRSQPRPYPRTARVNEVVLEALADELEHYADPRLGFVTLTEVEVAADLRHATVYYSVLGGEAQHRDTAEALRASGPRLRAALGRAVRLKYLPALEFRADPGVEHGERVEQIIRALHAPVGPEDGA